MPQALGYGACRLGTVDSQRVDGLNASAALDAVTMAIAIAIFFPI
jgi:hypothetical protein